MRTAALVVLAAAAMVCVAANAVPSLEGDAEAAILHRLKEALDGTTANATTAVGSPRCVCDWDAVECDEEGHVVAIRVVEQGENTPREPTGQPPAAKDHEPLRLPAELAQLTRLERLQFLLDSRAVVGGIPTAWAAPGALPTLTDLQILTPEVLPEDGMAVLPDLQPGALPQLVQVNLWLGAVPLPLPPSWGASPDTLPLLKSLVLSPVAGQLPAAWAQGFTKLQTLTLSGVGDSFVRRGNCGLRSTSGSKGSHRLPPQWAAGFPSLQSLHLACLTVSGSLPREWQEGGFPALDDLLLWLPGLTGTLPPQLLSRHPRLTRLSLDDTQLAGRLPDEWGESILKELSLQGNALEGDAFPPAWLLPGAMPRLKRLHLDGNAHLGGTLPANLPWPSIVLMGLAGTDLRGGIPPGWCTSPAAKTLKNMLIDWTALDPTPPACAHRSMPALAVVQDSRKVVQDRPSGAQQRWIRTVDELELGTLVLAVLVAAAAGGRLLLQRSLRRRGHFSSSHGHASSDGATWQVNAADDAAEAEAGAVYPALGLRARSQRARLEALLNAELDSGGGMPMAPAAVAHSFHGSSPRSSAGASEAWSDWASMQGYQHGGTTSTTNSSAAEQSEGAPLLAGAGAPGSGGQQGSPMHWRLPTKSLQVPVEQLTFVSNGRGLAILGEGSFGVVYLARLEETGVVAAKVVEVQPGLNSRAVWREVALWQRCMHRRILPLLGVAIKGPLLVLVTEVMAGGSLQAALRRPEMQQALRWTAGGRQVAADVAEALAFMHTHLRILHGDVKASNVLLSADLRASLGDLGLSIMLESKARTAAGCSAVYAAPEQLLGHRCTLAADVYSFGLLLVELTTQTFVRTRGGWRLPLAPEECPAAVLELVQECLRTDPAARPGAEEVLRRLQAASGSGGSS